MDDECGCMIRARWVYRSALWRRTGAARLMAWAYGAAGNRPERPERIPRHRDRWTACPLGVSTARTWFCRLAATRGTHGSRGRRRRACRLKRRTGMAMRPMGSRSPSPISLALGRRRSPLLLGILRSAVMPHGMAHAGGCLHGATFWDGRFYSHFLLVGSRVVPRSYGSGIGSVCQF